MAQRTLILFLVTIIFHFQGSAFCGFFVSKAGTNLFNKASKVVLVRDEDKTVISFASDYQGPLKEFAMVVPVPTILEKGQIHVTENKYIEHLDAYSAPRLVEYFDSDPCAMMMMRSKGLMMEAMSSAGGAPELERAKNLGVTIEAEYTIGEYDILILSAKESDGLITWLEENDYKIPNGASAIVSSYLKQGMKFFVAKVNLEEQAKLGFSYLRPLQFAFESPKFMLPIRLGMVNAKGDQELFIFALTKNGRVETTNYRTVKIPSEQEIPTYIKDQFPDFYRAMYETALKKESKGNVFLEYAWDMSWCDPCAADPLSNSELKELGVFWIDDNPNVIKPMNKRMIMPPSQAANVFITRLHLRYNSKTHPEDLQFQITGDRENFQGRYILRHEWSGEATCDAAKNYLEQQPKQREQKAQNLANLTGWNINKIRKTMNIPKVKIKNWWEKLWTNDDESK